MVKNKKTEILMVEDESVIREICRRVLTKSGYKVDFAENGQMAKEMIRKKEYSLFIIDIRTPVIDGQELYVWMLQEKPAQVDRIIFTTGDLMEGQTVRFINQSKKSFLPKPFTADELTAIVERKFQELERK